MADTEDIQHSNTDGMPPLQSGLAMAGGLGITLIVVGLALGVLDATLNSSTIGLLILTGFAFLVGAIAAWFGVVQPQKHFDDINVPKYHGHAHHEPAADDAAPAQH
ncbi:MAG: AtpZ/AtpI family protein [Anaerolineae bacterium]|nr:AtpZ/AtpI family protein [Anaerolineae bacterium]